MMFNAISMRPVPTAGDFPNHFRIAARTSSFMPRFPGSDAVHRRAVGSLGHDRREWEQASKGDSSSTFRSFWLVTCRYCIGRYSQYSLSDFQFAIELLNKGINCESGGSVGPWQKLFLWLLVICLSPRAPEESQGISAGLNIFCWSSLISMLPCTKCRKVFFTCTSQLD